MIRHIVLTLVAGLMLVGAAEAGQQRNSTDSWGGGVLVSIDAASKAIVVKQGEHEQRYQLGEEVTVFEGRSTLGVDGLDQGIGRQVRVRYELDGETRVASRVNVVGKKGAATVAASKSEAADKRTEP